MGDDAAFEAAVRLVRRAGKDPAAHSADEIVAALDLLREEIATRKSRVSSPGTDDAPAWYEHEDAAWQVASWIRAYLRKRRQHRGRSDLMDQVARFASDPRLGKGRQNFILVLGDYGRGLYVDDLIPQIDDDEVAAHVWSTLGKWRIPGLEDKASVLLDSSDVRLRRNVRKYLERVTPDDD